MFFFNRQTSAVSSNRALLAAQNRLAKVAKVEADRLAQGKVASSEQDKHEHEQERLGELLLAELVEMDQDHFRTITPLAAASPRIPFPLPPLAPSNQNIVLASYGLQPGAVMPADPEPKCRRGTASPLLRDRAAAETGAGGESGS